MKARYKGLVYDVEQIRVPSSEIDLYGHEEWVFTDLNNVELLFVIGHDMNGKEIYKGDTVYSNNLKLELTIIWDEQYLAYIGICPRGKRYLRWIGTNVTKVEKI
jgi:hypothetical protein